MSTYEENLLLEQIYRNYQEPLRRIAMAFRVPDLEVDDVVQETFIAYFAKYSLTWPEYRMKSALIKILRRKSIDCLRKYGRYKTVSLDDEDAATGAELLTRYMFSDPLDVVITNETLARIAAEISKIREDWKVIAVLYFLEQKTIPEICEILDIPGTVCRSRIYRTRRCLKKILGPRYDI